MLGAAGTAAGWLHEELQRLHGHLSRAFVGCGSFNRSRERGKEVSRPRSLPPPLSLTQDLNGKGR